MNLILREGKPSINVLKINKKDNALVVTTNTIFLKKIEFRMLALFS